MRDFIFATLCLAKICQLSVKLMHVLKSNFLKSCLQISLSWQSCAVDSNITRQRYIIKYTSATTFKNNLYLLFSHLFPQNYLPDPSHSLLFVLTCTFPLNLAGISVVLPLPPCGLPNLGRGPPSLFPFMQILSSFQNSSSWSLLKCYSSWFSLTCTPKKKRFLWHFVLQTGSLDHVTSSSWWKPCFHKGSNLRFLKAGCECSLLKTPECKERMPPVSISLH